MSELFCKFCLSDRVIKRGTSDTGKTRYRCKNCGRWGNSNSRVPRSAKILLLDIETLPGEYYAWSPKQDYLPANMMIKDWSISCWAAKWLFDDEIMGEFVTPQEAFERTEESILGGIWKLMNEADIIVTQNGIRFDIRKLNSKFIENDYPPVHEFQNVDTLVTARNVFGWTYNSLNELAKKLGIGEKIEMRFEDWKNCLTNNIYAEEALEHKLEYCKNDVAPLLEDVYLAMLPYMKKHPNLNLYTNSNKDVCPKCEGKITWSDKTYVTPQGAWESFRCGTCGATGRGTNKKHSIKKTSIK